MKKIFIFYLTVSIYTVFAQFDKYLIEPPYYIKTVKLDNGNKQKYIPFIKLGHTVYFSFDDLQADEKEYSYQIARFDENWQPTQLNESEYIRGFASDIITDVRQSLGTIQSYTHYRLKIPNESTQILLSGNYMLQVLDEDGEVLFSKPFIVYENKIDLGVQVRWVNDVSLKDRLQMIYFKLYKSGFNIYDETNNLTIRIFQNNDLNYSLEFHQPTFYQGDVWVYNYPQDALFEGINEFRRFECTDLRGYNYGIAYKKLNQLYDFYPYTGTYKKHYLYYKDLNGNYIISAEQAYDDFNIEADYVNVHFSFDGNLPDDENVYVIGRFNDFNPTENYRLSYNEETDKYEVSVLLKQAYYDYMFVTKNKEGLIDVASIEGSFAQTENDYTIVVYYRPPGARYTSVIGYATANSDQIQ